MAATIGPMVSGSRLPTRATSPPDHRDSAKHDHRERQQRRARRGGRVVLHLNEIQRDQPESRHERAVQEQRQEIGQRERPRPEQSRGAASVPAPDARRRRAAASDATPQPRASPSTSGRLAPSGGHSRSAKTTPPRPSTASAAPAQSIREVRDGVAALVHEPQRQHDDDRGQRHVQEKHRAPADVLDQPAAGDRSDGGCDRAEPGPRADRPAAIGVVERGADDREAARARGRRRRHPAAARPTMSTRVDAARPHAIDAMVNTTTPARNIRFRPN